MNNFIVGSFLRSSLHELQIRKCNLNTNNLHMNRIQFNSVLRSIDNFSSNQKSKCLFFLNSSFLQTPQILHKSHDRVKTRSVIQQYHNVLKDGVHRKNILFVNSLHLPTKLNVRYQSTTTEIGNETSATDIIEKVNESSWFVQDTEGINSALKDSAESAVATGLKVFLQDVHSYTGLPWWSTIIVTTFFIKTFIILPFVIHQRHTLVKLENCQLELQKIIPILKKEVSLSMKKFKWPVEFAKTKYQEMLKQEWKNIFARENTNPIKAYPVIAVQSTVWIGMSFAIANLCCALPHSNIADEPLYSELVTGGFEWITNLTVPDSSLILPFSVGLLNLGIVLVNYSKIREKNIVQKFTFSFLTMISVGMIPFAMQMPAGLVLYWVVSSGYGFIFNIMLAIPATRKILRIPEVKSEDQLNQEIEEWLTERKHSELIYEYLAEEENTIGNLQVNRVNNTQIKG